MRVTDWHRLRADIKGLSQASPALGNIAWTFLGIAISAGLALPPWLAAYDALTPQGQQSYFWVTATLVAASSAFLMISVVCFVAAHQVRNANKATIDTIVRDMDTILKPEGTATS